MKVCRVCKIELIVGENWNGSYMESNNYICRCCLKEYYEINIDNKKEYNKEYYDENKEKIKEYSKEYNEKNKEKRKEWKKEYYDENKEKIKEYSKEYNAKPETKKKNNERVKSRMRNDPWFDAQCKLRKSHTRLIKNLLNGKDRDFSAVRNLGCDKEVFLVHIESQFLPGMTWENRGKGGWHYDHIIPIGSIDPNDREAVLKVLHYTNLRPLWAEDNLMKSAEDKKKSFRKKI